MHASCESRRRSGGLSLIIAGVLLVAILLAGFRRNQQWAWWTMWSVPAWMASIALLNLVFGVAPGQAPPPPLISGLTLTILAVTILVVSAPRFFGSTRSMSPQPTRVTTNP